MTVTFPKILGIDPGSRLVGFALLSARVLNPRQPRDFRVTEAGVLKADPAQNLPMRLGMLHNTMFDLLCEFRPDVCVVERAFFGVNAASAIKLGEARGALLAAICRAEIPVAEITPAEVKRAITGGGAAGKEQVALAVEGLLGFRRGDLPFDVTDAAAIALTHGLSLCIRRIVADKRPRRELNV